MVVLDSGSEHTMAASTKANMAIVQVKNMNLVLSTALFSARLALIALRAWSLHKSCRSAKIDLTAD